MPRRDGVTVLLVEDDELMRGLTRQILEEHGYHVLEAKDGIVAQEVASSHSTKIDLLLTDVVMRGVSGPELVTHLRQLRPEITAIYMSGYTGELIAKNDAGGTHIPLLEKPFTRAKLLRILHDALP